MKTNYVHYAHKNHWKYVKESLLLEPSDLGKTVANILGYVGGGLYNCPVDLKKVDWTNKRCIEVIWCGNLTNWDDSGLSRLWVLCHRNMIRVEINATAIDAVDEFADEGDENLHHCSVPELHLLFFQRESRVGGVMTRLPDCEDMIRDIDDDFSV